MCFRYKDNVRFCISPHAPEFFFLGSDALKVDVESPDGEFYGEMTNHVVRLS